MTIDDLEFFTDKRGILTSRRGDIFAIHNVRNGSLEDHYAPTLRIIAPRWLNDLESCDKPGILGEIHKEFWERNA